MVGGERGGGWWGEKGGGMVGGERGRDWEGLGGMEKGGGNGGKEGGQGDGWRGDGVVWSGIGRGAKLTHLGLNVAHVCSCSLSPVSVHGHCRPCPFMGAGHHSWCMVAILAGGGLCASSCMGDGEGRRWVSLLVRSGLVVVVVACVPSWVLGISCGRWWLVVVILGLGGVISGWWSSFSWAVHVVTVERLVGACGGL